uniref:Uncharacterized protein n=1 Tax=Acrobeloides nanus TaxID=290746 RepID=A0A914E1P5_9BILA
MVPYGLGSVEGAAGYGFTTCYRHAPQSSGESSERDTRLRWRTSSSVQSWICKSRKLFLVPISGWFCIALRWLGLKE